MNQRAKLSIYLTGYDLRIGAVRVVVSSQEDLVLVPAVDYRTKLIAEAVLCYHASCYLCGAFKVIGSTCRNIVEHDLFSRTSAQKGDDLFGHLRL